MIDLIALSAAKKHADLLAMGLTSVSVDNTNKSITFTLAADGSQRTIYFDQPSDGVSIIGVEIKNGHLICLMSDGSEIDAGTLPSGGSGSGSNVQPDWNQNDSAAPDYVKNRPFYTDDTVVTELFDVCALVEEAGASWIEEKEDGIFFTRYAPEHEMFIDTPPAIGDECIIIYNGTSYSSAAVDGESIGGDPGMIVIGDIDGFITGNMTYGVAITLVPYTFIDSTDTSDRIILASAMVYSDVVPTELKVIDKKVEIKKIDEKYIPLHNQAASTITSGIFSGEVSVGSYSQTPSTMLLRNSKLVSNVTSPSNDGEICWMYE